MAFYSSYNKEAQVEKRVLPAEKGLRPTERVPLASINGNQKPRAKDLPQSTQFFKLLEDTYSGKSSFPFSIFSDDEPKNDVKEEKSEKKAHGSSCRTVFADLFDFDTSIPDFENFSPIVKEKPTDYFRYDFPYKADYFKHLRQLEQKHSPNPNYMRLQPEIDSGMRRTVVDWLVDVGLQFDYCSETIHLTVSLMDRFLSCTSVTKDKIQLVAAACLFTAAKYEEVCPQDLEAYSWITASTYSKKQIRRMEQIVMERLRFYVGAPTSISYMNMAFNLAYTPERVLYLGQYLCELALLDDYPFLNHLPSSIGVGAYCLARYILGYIMWIDELEITGYTLNDLKPAIESLFNKINKVFRDSTNKFRGIPDKYKTPGFMKVSEINPPEILIMCN